MFQTYFRTIFKIDKKSTFICIIYNLLKQLLNVFYGVYFLRLILVHVETDRDLTAVLWVLLGMLAINVAFHFGDQYFKNVYTPVFQTKLEQYLYEMISDRAADVPYDQYCQPEFLNLYQRLLDNTAKNILQVWNVVRIGRSVRTDFVLYREGGLVCDRAVGSAAVLFLCGRGKGRKVQACIQPGADLSDAKKRICEAGILSASVCKRTADDLGFPDCPEYL